MKKIHITPGVIKRFKQFLTGKYIEDGATASQNIPAGKWIIWKGQVCKAKTAITAGDTLSSTNLDGSTEGMVNDLQDSFEKSAFGTNSVNISSYNSVSNYYTCPSDGYVIIYNKDGGILGVKSNGTGFNLLDCTVADYHFPVYVKKGMKLYTVRTSSATFIPLE